MKWGTIRLLARALAILLCVGVMVGSLDVVGSLLQSYGPLRSDVVRSIPVPWGQSDDQSLYTELDGWASKPPAAGTRVGVLDVSVRVSEVGIDRSTRPPTVHFTVGVDIRASQNHPLVRRVSGIFQGG